MGLIVNRQKNDIRLSVIWKICENSEIQFADLFDSECAGEFNIEKFILTDGNTKYGLKKI